MGLHPAPVQVSIQRDRTHAHLDHSILFLSSHTRVCAHIAQVTWIGYPNTTGLPTIEFRLTDAVVDPVDTKQKVLKPNLGVACVIV